MPAVAPLRGERGHFGFGALQRGGDAAGQAGGLRAARSRREPKAGMRIEQPQALQRIGTSVEQTGEKIHLNLLSRAILGVTLALGLGVVLSAAPTHVAALGRANLKPVAITKPLTSSPGIVLTRAYGVDDEDCVSIAPGGGATPNRMVCAR